MRTATEEHIFASFFFRDHTHSILREVWRILTLTPTPTLTLA